MFLNLARARSYEVLPLFIGLFAVVALAGDDPASGLEGLTARLTEHGKAINWEAEFPHFERHFDRMWKENGWNDEADCFSHDLIRDVARIPPWQVMDRLNLASDRAAERYGMKGTERLWLKAKMVREASGFLLRNSKVILQQFSEASEFFAGEKPLNPDQVARWTRDAEPLTEDFNQMVKRIVSDIEPRVDEQHRDALRRDVGSYDKQRQFWLEKMTRWKEGDWRPDDWGLQDHPAHRDLPVLSGSESNVFPRVLAANSDGEIGPDYVNSLPKWVNHDRSTWFAYVIEMERKYHFDSGQMNTAKSIHDEVFERAGAYVAANTEELKAVSLSARGKHEIFAPVRMMFDELRSRLDAIPTSAQQTNASR
ncbi:MAG: hypothetical protein AABZ47_04580 [Planctomycetota bacterium]